MLVLFSLKPRTSQGFWVLLYSTEGVSQNNKTKKETKGDWKERSNFSLLIDNMVVSIENFLKA